MNIVRVSLEYLQPDRLLLGLRRLTMYRSNEKIQNAFTRSTIQNNELQQYPFRNYYYSRNIQDFMYHTLRIDKNAVRNGCYSRNIQDFMYHTLSIIMLPCGCIQMPCMLYGEKKTVTSFRSRGHIQSAHYRPPGLEVGGSRANTIGVI